METHRKRLEVERQIKTKKQKQQQVVTILLELAAESVYIVAPGFPACASTVVLHCVRCQSSFCAAALLVCSAWATH